MMVSKKEAGKVWTKPKVSQVARVNETRGGGAVVGIENTFYSVS